MITKKLNNCTNNNNNINNDDDKIVIITVINFLIIDILLFNKVISHINWPQRSVVRHQVRQPVEGGCVWQPLSGDSRLQGA